jgi:uncharacterized protein (DUF2342 family)
MATQQLAQQDQRMAAPAQSRQPQKAQRQQAGRRRQARLLHLARAVLRVRQQLQQTGRKAVLQVQPEAAAEQEQQMVPQASSRQRVQQQTRRLGHQRAHQAVGCRLRVLELRTR